MRLGEIKTAKEKKKRRAEERKRSGKKQAFLVFIMANSLQISKIWLDTYYHPRRRPLGFVRHSFISPPTNKPQRTSAGRLVNGARLLILRGAHLAHE